MWVVSVLRLLKRVCHVVLASGGLFLRLYDVACFTKVLDEMCVVYDGCLVLFEFV